MGFNATFAQYRRDWDDYPLLIFLFLWLKPMGLRSIEPLAKASLPLSILQKMHIRNYIQNTSIYKNNRLVYVLHFYCHNETVQKQMNPQPHLDLRIHTEAGCQIALMRLCSSPRPSLVEGLGKVEPNAVVLVFCCRKPK